jgi:hypothetical protein
MTSSVRVGNIFVLFSVKDDELARPLAVIGPHWYGRTSFCPSQCVEGTWLRFIFRPLLLLTLTGIVLPPLLEALFVLPYHSASESGIIAISTVVTLLLLYACALRDPGVLQLSSECVCSQLVAFLCKLKWVCIFTGFETCERGDQSSSHGVAGGSQMMK